jgi:hypothetical protein
VSCGARPPLNCSVFVCREIVTQVSFTAATARLENLLRGNALRDASRSAYDDGLTALIPVGPAPGFTRLVRAQFRDLVLRGGTAMLTVRWEASGPGAGLFPVLDADITLTPAGDEATLLRLDGSYRPPLGAAGAMLDRAVMNRVAAATIRSLLRQISDALASPHPSTGTHAAPGTAPRTDPGTA